MLLPTLPAVLFNIAFDIVFDIAQYCVQFGVQYISNYILHIAHIARVSIYCIARVSIYSILLYTLHKLYKIVGNCTGIRNGMVCGWLVIFTTRISQHWQQWQAGGPGPRASTGVRGSWHLSREQGSNFPSGSNWRLAAGTMVCWHTIS